MQYNMTIDMRYWKSYEGGNAAKSGAYLFCPASFDSTRYTILNHF
jgi:hypothetical protein